MIKHSASVLGTLLAVLFVCAGNSLAAIPAEVLPSKAQYLQRLFERITSNWEPCDLPLSLSAQGNSRVEPAIKFFISQTGEIRDAEIVRSTGFIAADLAALDAIWSCSPFQGQCHLQDSEWPLSIICDFTQLRKDSTAKLKWSARNAYEISDSDGTPEAYYLARLIPLEILQRYPGVLTEQQLLQCGVKELPIGEAKRDLDYIRRAWSLWYPQNPTPTAAEILQKSNQVQAAYSRCFRGYSKHSESDKQNSDNSALFRAVPSGFTHCYKPHS